MAVKTVTTESAAEAGAARESIWLPGDRHALRLRSEGSLAVAEIVVPPVFSGLVIAEIPVDRFTVHADYRLGDDRCGIYFDDDQQRDLALAWITAFYRGNWS